MQTVKLKVSVRNRRIVDELPAEVPDGEAEVVIYYQEESASVEQARRRHLTALFASIDDDCPKRSREDIDRQIPEERASWGD